MGAFLSVLGIWPYVIIGALAAGASWFVTDAIKGKQLADIQVIADRAVANSAVDKSAREAAEKATEALKAQAAQSAAAVTDAHNQIAAITKDTDDAIAFALAAAPTDKVCPATGGLPPSLLRAVDSLFGPPGAAGGSPRGSDSQSSGSRGMLGVLGIPGGTSPVIDIRPTATNR